MSINFVAKIIAIYIHLSFTGRLNTRVAIALDKRKVNANGLENMSVVDVQTKRGKKFARIQRKISEQEIA